MTGDPGSEFDPFTLGNRRSLDVTSPIEYVRGLLNQRFRVLLIDGIRQILGIFVAFDHQKTLTLKDCVEITEGHERELGVVLIPLAQVQSIELAV
jgi:small nuclear ribonucleoprotein (snRNP)-like protein